MTYSADTEPSSPIPENRVLIVPRVPGALLDPDDLARERPPDAIDEAIEEIFGPDPGDAPGRVDAILVLVGCGLLLWAQLSLHSGGVTVLGAALTFLGLVLPLRSLWRKASARRISRKRQALSSRGFVLSASHPLTRDLVGAYRELLAAAELPSAPLATDAVTAAHLALVESAELLSEQGPENPAEAEYVERRIAAIRNLTVELERHSRLAEQGRVDDQGEEHRLQRTARVLAGQELDETGLSSLRELDDLKRILAPDSDD